MVHIGLLGGEAVFFKVIINDTHMDSNNNKIQLERVDEGKGGGRLLTCKLVFSIEVMSFSFLSFTTRPIFFMYVVSIMGLFFIFLIRLLIRLLGRGNDETFRLFHFSWFTRYS